MDKETQKKLTKDFPKSVVKSAPAGKFGDYVPHHIYTQRLVDVIVEVMTLPLKKLEIKLVQSLVLSADCTLNHQTKQ